MTSENIEVSEVEVTHEVVDASVERISAGESGPITVEVRSAGTSGPPGPVGPQGIQGVKGDTGEGLVSHLEDADPHTQYLKGADVPVVTTNLVFMHASGWAANSATITASTSRSVTVTTNGGLSAGILASAPLNRPTASPGQTFTVSGYITASAATTYSVILDFFDGPGARIALTNTIYAVAPNTRTFVTHTFTTPAGSAWVYPKFYSGSIPAGNTVIFEDIVLTEGTKIWPYFDGSMPGNRWTGTPFKSTTEKVLISSVDVPALPGLPEVRADHLYYRGTGSPEGNVTASVGSRYTDTAATNGAVEWIKTAGSGNTGWKVVYGDTGWRNLSVPENFVMVSVVPAYQIRRTAEGVYFRARVTPNGSMIGNAKTATFTALDIPTGFLPDFKGYLPQGVVMFSPHMGLLHTTASRATLHGVFYPASGATGTWAGTESIYMNAQWDTDSQWPTTLPGTAA